MTPDPEQTAAEQTAAIDADDPKGMIHLSGNAPIEIFPFVTQLHREVVLRHRDGESQDIELTPDEADRVADMLRAAAATARAARQEA